MGKRKRKKISSTLTWKAIRGFFGLLFQGVQKGLPLFLFFLVSFAIFWGIRTELFADPGFLVQEVEILSQEALLPPEKIQELEKFYLGRNLFKISLAEAAKRIEEDPRIFRARVIKKFPSTLQIEIWSRKPAVQFQSKSKGPFYLAGEDGVILMSVTERRPELLLVDVSGVPHFKPGVGKPSEISGFKQGLALVRAFEAHPLGKNEMVESLRIDRLGNVTLVLRKGPELRFGRTPLKKLEMLNAAASLLGGPDRGRIVYIELQYQDLIVKKK